MPLKIPVLDDRKYQDIIDEALARIPVHTPEWTNFNKSDPGVTLIEVFAFLTENLLYRCNQIPERNRRKFLTLLGIPLREASSANGIVMFLNERGPARTITLNAGMEVRAGEVPFRTEQGLDLLPIEARVYYKRSITAPSEKLKDYYKQLYASYMGQPPAADPQLYETVPLITQKNGVDLGTETIDASLWIALLARPSEDVKNVRREIANKIVSLGVVPALGEAERRLSPGAGTGSVGETFLEFQIPAVPADGILPNDPQKRVPQYKPLIFSTKTDVLAEPGIVQIILPGADEIGLWSNLGPLEHGVGDFPPPLEDTKLNNRIITWLRVRSPARARARLLWVGINSMTVTQRAHVSNERLPSGTGEPDQVAALSKTPVIHRSVRLSVNGVADEWKEINDLLSAGPEVQVPDLRRPPGAKDVKNPLVKVFTVNPESGEIRFGDGLHGARLPSGATVLADYDYGAGLAGNVNADSINTGPALPPGVKVTNPVRTWGGAEAETVSEGEKQVARYLQHHDRLVKASDFETIVMRTPGVDIGRVEVIPAYNPELAQNEPGDTPGAVTLMIIPKYDPSNPDAPGPDRLFLNAICDHIESKRLVTTEVFLRGPVYKPIWVSVGINVEAGKSIAEVREAVKQELLRFLSPLQSYEEREKGWPLRTALLALQLLAVASRVRGISLINKVLLAEGTKGQDGQVEMKGLELPRVMGISVTIGEPLGLEQLRGQTLQAGPGGGAAPAPVPIPVVQEECR